MLSITLEIVKVGLLFLLPDLLSSKPMPGFKTWAPVQYKCCSVQPCSLVLVVHIARFSDFILYGCPAIYCHVEFDGVYRYCTAEISLYSYHIVSDYWKFCNLTNR